MSSGERTSTSKARGKFVELLPLIALSLVVVVWAVAWYTDARIEFESWTGLALGSMGVGLFLRSGIVFAYPQVAIDHDIGLSGRYSRSGADIDDFYEAQVHALGTIALGIFCLALGWVAFTN